MVKRICAVDDAEPVLAECRENVTIAKTQNRNFISCHEQDPESRKPKAQTFA